MGGTVVGPEDQDIILFNSSRADSAGDLCNAFDGRVFSFLRNLSLH